ncbi:MAG: hypothetical protein MCS20_01685, partial [Candidatus Phytoplasma mali]|nr:hypothetical protein [Candidatus Phytoplasma mali]
FNSFSHIVIKKKKKDLIRIKLIYSKRIRNNKVNLVIDKINFSLFNLIFIFFNCIRYKLF